MKFSICLFAALGLLSAGGLGCNKNSEAETPATNSVAPPATNAMNNRTPPVTMSKQDSNHLAAPNN